MKENINYRYICGIGDDKYGIYAGRKEENG